MSGKILESIVYLDPSLGVTDLTFESPSLLDLDLSLKIIRVICHY